MRMLRALFAAKQRFYQMLMLRLLFARSYLQVNQPIKIEHAREVNDNTRCKALRAVMDKRYVNIDIILILLFIITCCLSNEPYPTCLQNC